MKITVKLDTRKATDRLNGMPEAIRRVSLRALHGTADEVIKAEQAEMRRVFDRPTRWTLNALRKYPDKREASITIEINRDLPFYTRTDNYLQTQITGGTRRNKAFERALQARGVLPHGWYAVPGQRAKMDAFGNQSPGELKQILSWFDAASMHAGSEQNMGFAGREKRRKGTKARAGWVFFVVRPGDRRSGIKQPGIYRRTGRSTEPILIFVKATTYTKRFDFEGVAQRTIEADYPARFESEMKVALEK